MTLHFVLTAITDSNEVHFENPIVAQLANKFLAFYTTQIFISAFTRAIRIASRTMRSILEAAPP
jgi:hypothetical protein